MKRLMSFGWVCLMSVSMLSAQGVEEVTLVVSGDGATKEEATHVALRSAIEQAYGTFVSANTEILNDSVVKDEIVTISNGSISSYEEINVTELDSALLSITLRATVSVNKLISYAKSKGSSCELSGALLMQEKRMLEMNIANTKKALNHLFTLVNEFVEKNDLYTYTLKTYNVKMDGSVTAMVTCRWNENADNLDKMIKDYLSAISIDKGQVRHLSNIGFDAPGISYWGDSAYYDWYNEKRYTTCDYRIYAPLSCVSKELRQCIQKNIDRRASILFTDNLGFVYPISLGKFYTSFFVSDHMESPYGVTLSLGDHVGKREYYKFAKKYDIPIRLQIPEQNMEALSNIDIVPYSDSRFSSLMDSLMNQANEYAVPIGEEPPSSKDVYYCFSKMGLYYSILNSIYNYQSFRENHSEEEKKITIDWFTSQADVWKNIANYSNDRGINNGRWDDFSNMAQNISNELSEIVEQLTTGENLYRSTWEFNLYKSTWNFK